MNRALNLPSQQDDFKRFIGVSAALHVSIFLVFTIKAFFFPDQKFEYQAAIKVDMVALPDKTESIPTPEPAAEESTTQPETAKPQATPAPQPQDQPKAPPTKVLAEKVPKKTLDPEAINLKTSKKKEQAALEKLKQMNALEELERQENEEASRDAKKRALEKLKQIKGNALSSGSELKGVAKLQHDNYLSLVERHIRQSWSLPEWLSKKNLSAQVRVRFDENGLIISHEIAKSSGNPTFDDLALATVKKASPVPAPPAKFVKILNAEGILLGFPE